MELEAQRAEYQIDAISGERDTQRLSELLDSAFQVPAGRRFFDDFPIWNEKVVATSNSIVRLGVFAPAPARELVASVGVRLATLSPELPVALIGAVATDERYRGHGFASELVSFATRWATAKGAAASFLWGSEHALYQRLGFELCGTQVLVPLPKMKTSSSYELREGWSPSLMGLLTARTGGLRVQASDWRWLAAHRGVRWIWATDEDGLPVAYAALGRGIDLANIVHEWGGNREALHTIFSKLAQESSDFKLLGSKPILESYGISCEGFPLESLCLAKVLNPGPIARWVDPAFQGSFTREGDGYRLGDALLSERDWARELFGVPNFWIWGLDAV